MIAYKITDSQGWTKEKDTENGLIKIEPTKYKSGIFLLLGQEHLWPELKWSSLEKIELTENDFIKEDIL